MKKQHLNPLFRETKEYSQWHNSNPNFSPSLYDIHNGCNWKHISDDFNHKSIKNVFTSLYDLVICD